MRRDALLLGGIFEEGANAGELSRCRCRPKAARTPVGKKGSKIGRVDGRQNCCIDRFAPVPPEEFDQPMCRSAISAHRMGGAAPVVLEK